MGLRRRYTPEYQKEIDQLKSGEAAPEEEEKEEKVEDGVTKFAKEIEAEEKQEEVKVEEKPTKKEEEEEERKLAMVGKRHQRLHEKMNKEEKDKE